MPRDQERGQTMKEVLVITKIGHVLDAFEHLGPELSQSRICEVTDMPTTTTVRLLSNMVRIGLLELTPGGYRPGPRLMLWGGAAADVRNLELVAQPILDRLRDDTGETAALFVRQGNYRVIASMAPTHHVVVYTLDVGQRMPLHAGSAGRILMAYGGSDAIPEGRLARFTDSTITGRQLLEKSLKAVRADGYAVSYGERSSGVVSISAPVFGSRGELVAAVCLAGPAQRFGEKDVRTWSPLVVRAAERMSNLLADPDPRPAVSP